MLSKLTSNSKKDPLDLELQYLQKKLELLNKRRHFHPIEIVKFIRSKVSFAKILKLHDDAEVKEMEH